MTNELKSIIKLLQTTKERIKRPKDCAELFISLDSLVEGIGQVIYKDGHNPGGDSFYNQYSELASSIFNIINYANPKEREKILDLLSTEIKNIIIESIYDACTNNELKL